MDERGGVLSTRDGEVGVGVGEKKSETWGFQSASGKKLYTCRTFFALNGEANWPSSSSSLGHTIACEVLTKIQRLDCPRRVEERKSQKSKLESAWRSRAISIQGSEVWPAISVP